MACEGATEERLLKELRGRWRLPALKIEIAGQRGVPSSVVAYAEGRARELRRELGRNATLEVWVAFDRDEHPSWMDAIERARRLGFRLAISNPCFELWALLLHRDQTAHLHRHDAQRRLREVHRGFDHEKNPYLDADVVLGCGDRPAPGDSSGLPETRIEAARRRCEQVLRRAAEAGDEYGNPTSRFPDLVARLRKLSEF